MSDDSTDRRDTRDEERDSSVPMLRGWWADLSGPAKVLIPISAAMFVFVSVSALPPVIF
jgi:hypothetical protein